MRRLNLCKNIRGRDVASCRDGDLDVGESKWVLILFGSRVPNTTTDGSEIRRLPVEVGSLSRYLPWAPPRPTCLESFMVNNLVCEMANTLIFHAIGGSW